MLWDTVELQLIVQSLAATIPRLSNKGTVFGIRAETFRSQPNAITATFQDALTYDWREGTKRWSGDGYSGVGQYQYSIQRLSSVVSTSPVVFPKCSPAQNMSTGAGQVSFPVKTWRPRNFNDSTSESPEWEVKSKAYNVIIPKKDTTHSLQHQWIDLPTDQFGPVSGGLLLRLPGVVPNTSQAVVACSISAFWFSSQVTSDSVTDQAAWSFTELMKTPRPKIRTDLNASSAEASKSRRLISIRDDWFRSLTPQTPCVSHGNQYEELTTLQCLFSDVGLTTVFEDMRTHLRSRWNGETCVYQPPNPSETDVELWNQADCGNGGKHQLLEMMLASVFANGLSRYGSRHAFDPISIRNSPYDPSRWLLKSLPRAPDYYASLLSNKPHHDAILPAPALADSKYITLRMHMQVFGYAWYASGYSEYLAITVVVIYMLIALAHTIWVVTKGITSSSWDTMTELLSLALQSPASKALRGTGAGIERLETYQRIMKLRVRDEGKDAKVVLVVDEDGDNTNNMSSPFLTTGVSYRRVKTDEEYV
ncbi:MAG: hypothetical protein Q9184_004956 [Pyrenodesmia sp. 2 TL-2023]